MSPKKSKLFGRYYVKPSPTAFKEAHDLFPRMRDYQELRRHALKLAFWPSGETDESGQVMDLDWDRIAAAGRPPVYELRISDVINGHDNLRVIFYVGDRTSPKDPLPRIWILSVLQKKSQRFTQRHTAAFRARRTIIAKRYACSN